MKHTEQWIWLPEDIYKNEQTTVYSGFNKDKADNYTVAEFKRTYNFSQKVVKAELRFSGDTVFNQSYGRTDLPTGSSAQLIQSFERLFLIAGDRAVYPGHGDSTTLSFERKYNPIVAYLHAE